MIASCPREREMSEAATAGVVSADLRGHAGTCQACLTTWLTGALHASAAPAPRLNPSALWEQAGRMRRLRAEAQMARIMTGAQVAIGMIILAVLVFFGTQSATWTSFPFAAANSMHLAAGVGLLLLAAAGVSRLITQDS